METEQALYCFLYYDIRLQGLKILLSDQARIVE